MKKRTHTFAITVTFDKSCSTTHALQEVRDTIHGEFYPTQMHDTDPGIYRVGKIKRVPVKAVPQ